MRNLRKRRQQALRGRAAGVCTMVKPRARAPSAVPAPQPAGTARTRKSDTSATQHQKRVARLPHEADESADSQRAEPTSVGKQAFNDVRAGLRDTDRGPVADKAYRSLKRGSSR